MNDFFVYLLLGHLIGDFLLQNKWMAVNKSASHFKCIVHCTIYTLSVSCLTWQFIPNLYWPMIVFLTHFPIDRWNLADKWLQLINGRSLTDYIKNGKQNIPNEYDFENYHVLRGGFTSVVYTATDNTMHLTLMVFAAKLFL